MQPAEPSLRAPRWTRRRLLRTALGGGAVVGGGAAMAVGAGGSLAAPSKATDADILAVFAGLERVQEAFYREALRVGRLTDELRAFAQEVGEQESEHVAFL